MILLLEDESQSADAMAAFLEHHGFGVAVARDGHEALRLLDIHAERLRLAVLDIMVPGPDGYEVCRHIRNHPALSGLPVIFLTAKVREQDEIDGLRLGADDYIAKPASPALVLAHIHTVLRRRSAPEPKRGLQVDRKALSATLDGVPLDLTAMEYRILALLAGQPNRVFSRQEILDQIADGERAVFDRTVDAHIKNLRGKLGTHGRRIRTVRGIGYGLKSESP